MSELEDAPSIVWARRMMAVAPKKYVVRTAGGFRDATEAEIAASAPALRDETEET